MTQAKDTGELDRQLKMFNLELADLKAQHSTAMDETERLQQDLQRVNNELESIISIVSHDFRSPLVNIKGFSSEIAKSCEQIKNVLDKIEMDPKQRSLITSLLSLDIPESLSFIQNSAKMINDLILGLTQVARIDLVKIEIRQLDVNQIVKDVAATFASNLQEAGCDIEIEPLPSCRGDAVQITQAFTSIIDNAIKYRKITDSCTVRISGKIQNDMCIYAIQDNSMGIKSEDLDKIFDVFYRVGADKNGGEGLGLSIAKRIIDRHNGKIWVESEFGKGSTFYISLPC